MKTHRFLTPIWILIFFLLAQGMNSLCAAERFQLLAGEEIPGAQFIRQVEGNLLVLTNREVIRVSRDRTRAVLTLPEGYWQTVFSRNAHYFAVFSLQSLPDLSRNRTLRVQVYRSDLQPLYSLETIQYYDDPFPAVAVSDANGALVLGRIPTGEMWFYNPEGEVIKHATLFPDSEFDLERILALEWSVDGRTLLALATVHGIAPRGSNAPEPDGHPTLFRFSREGELEWQQELPGDGASVAALSPAGNWMAAASYTIYTDGRVEPHLQLFDRSGEEQFHGSLLPKHLAFSPDEAYLLMAENQRVALVDVVHGKQLWQYDVPSSGGLVAAIALAPQANPTALLIARSEFRNHGFVFVAPRVQLLNPAGRIEQTVEFPQEAVDHPSLQFLSNGKEILIGLNNNYQIYGIK